MVRQLLSYLCVLLLAFVTGCASSGGGVNQDEVAAAGIPSPSLSLSATRTIPQRDLVVSIPEDSVDVQEENPLVSVETGVTFYRFQVGDPIVIHLRGIYPKDDMVEDIVDEDGNVTIPLIGDILAAGKSTAQLEADVTRMYIDGGYYRVITVNVVMPSRTYFIRGEIRNPGRFAIVSGVTIMQAIAAAGGYTEFASQRSIKLIRGGTTTTINMKSIERNPEKDIRLESGDVIVVDRSIL